MSHSEKPVVPKNSVDSSKNSLEDFMQYFLQELSQQEWTTELDKESIIKILLHNSRAEFIDFLNRHQNKVGATALAEAVHFHNEKMIDFCLENMNQKMLTTKDQYGNHAIYEASKSQGNIALLKALLKTNKMLPFLRSTKTLDDILFQSPLDVAIKYKNDDAIKVLAPLYNKHLPDSYEEIPGYGAPDIQQRTLDSHLKAAWKLIRAQEPEAYHIDAVEDIIGPGGNCQGWSFLKQIYEGQDKEEQFYEMIKFLSIWDETDGLDNFKDDKKFSLLKAVYETPRHFFEEVIGHLSLAQASTKQIKQKDLGIDQDKQLQIYSMLTSGSRRLDEHFLPTPQDSSSPEAVIQWLSTLANYPNTKCDISLKGKKFNHKVHISVEADGQLRLYDPNYADERVSKKTHSPEVIYQLLNHSSNIMGFKELKFESKLYNHSDINKEKLSAKQILNDFLSEAKKSKDFDINQNFGWSQEPLVIQCAKLGDVDGFRELINLGADVNITHKNYLTGEMNVLICAIEQDRYEMVSYLLSEHPELAYRQFSVSLGQIQNALTYAINENIMEAVRLLIDKGPDSLASEVITKGWYEGHNALTYALLRNNIEAVKMILEKQPESANHTITNRNNKGFTALTYAIKNNQADAIRFLLESNYNLAYDTIYVETDKGHNALTYAIKHKKSDAIRFLLESNPKLAYEIICTGNDKGHNALTYAIKTGNQEAIDIILEKSPELSMEIAHNPNSDFIQAEHNDYSDLILGDDNGFSGPDDFILDDANSLSGPDDLILDDNNGFSGPDDFILGDANSFSGAENYSIRGNRVDSNEHNGHANTLKQEEERKVEINSDAHLGHNALTYAILNNQYETVAKILEKTPELALKKVLVGGCGELNALEYAELSKTSKNIGLIELVRRSVEQENASRTLTEPFSHSKQQSQKRKTLTFGLKAAQPILDRQSSGNLDRQAPTIAASYSISNSNETKAQKIQEKKNNRKK